jgi:hypothetical protein
MLVDHAVQHAVVGGAGLIPGKTVGHADDVGAVSGRQQSRESDTRHAWGWEGERRRPGGCLFPGTRGPSPPAFNMHSRPELFSDWG